MSKKPLKKSDAAKPWAAYRDRRRANRVERRYILIASEDEKSSIFYFNSFKELLQNHSATLGIIPKGTGRNTQGLVDFVKKHQKEWLNEVREDVCVDEFNEIWVVFDYDSFPKDKFDNAIRSAGAYGYHVAWSNECFELWYLLHFKPQVSGISRQEIYAELTKALKLKSDYEELKGDKGRQVHERMATHSNVEQAIRRAKKLYLEFLDSGNPPHAGNPCTLVFELVEKLLTQLEK